MPLEIKDMEDDAINFGDSNGDDYIFAFCYSSLIKITKEQAEQIIQHLQEQFLLNP